MRLLKLLFIIFIYLGMSNLFAQSDLNLDFEKANSKGEPKGYFMGLPGYKCYIDTTIFFSGKSSLCVEYTTGNQYKFIAVSRTFPIADIRGKKFKFSMYIKTDSVTGYGGYYIRADGKDSTLAFVNNEEKSPKGTTGWTKYSSEIFVPKESVALYFGPIVSGSGKAWFDNIIIEVDGVAYPQPDYTKLYLNENEKDWLNKNISIFNSADPKNGNDDIRFLKNMVGNSKIVALGECTYGTSEFAKMKHRIVKFLAEEMDFTVFAIETNMPEAKLINDYIQTGSGEIKKILAGLSSWILDTQEFLNLIEWMRQFNASGKSKIELWGFDFQNETRAIEIVKDFLKTADPGYLAKATEAYNTISDARMELKVNTTIKPGDAYLPPYELAKEVVNYLTSKAGEYEKKSSKKEIDYIIRTAKTIAQIIGSYIPKTVSKSESLADNIDWIINQYPAGTKIALWAHNNFVSKSNVPSNTMGAFLNNKYKNDFISIGFAFHSGTYTARGIKDINTYNTSPSQLGSIEWFLHTIGKERIALDLRKVPGGPLQPVFSITSDFRSIRTLPLEDAFNATRILNDFDAIIYFDTTTPTGSFRKSTK
jgi:erythromycin esterase